MSLPETQDLHESIVVRDKGASKERQVMTFLRHQGASLCQAARHRLPEEFEKNCASTATYIMSRIAGSFESPRTSLNQPLTGVERIHFVEILGA